MASRSDQLHSHQFTLQRVIKALALRDPDAVASPTRRAGGAAFASVMVAALALAAVGIYGLLRPSGSPSWRDGRAVIIEKETGARFVFRDGVLYPVLNHASALLIVGAQQGAPVLVARQSLADVPRGTRLGIAGAPDPLPAAADLVAGAWTLCSRRGADRPESLLLVNAPPSPSLGDRALLAEDPLGGVHLLWQGRRYPVSHRTVGVTALGWAGRTPTALTTAVLNAIPVGPAIEPLAVPDAGRPSVVDGARVGQVVKAQTEGGPPQYAVALAAGLAEITELQANLLLTAATSGTGRPVDLTPAAFAALPRAASLVPSGDVLPPATTPPLAQPAAAAAVCASFVDGSVLPRLEVRSDASRSAREVRVTTATPGAAATVDWVAVPPGRGVLVASGGALALVSDLGTRFAVPSNDALTALGYAGVSPVRLPASLVALLPTGAALDPAAALRATA